MSSFKITGRVEAWYYRQGYRWAYCSGSNLVMAVGKNLVASIISSTSDRPSHMALGDDETAVDSAQTDLQGTELVRAAFDSNTVNGRILTLVKTFTNPGPGNWDVREAGIFNDPSAGTMFARWLPSPNIFASGDAVKISWHLDFGGE